MKKMISSALSLCLLASCSSTTMITSSDKDSKIYINGEYMGTGSVTYTDTRIVGSTNMVKIKKDGCEPENFTFQRNEEFDAGACAGGVFTLVPFLWIMKYKPTHNYEYTCKPTKN